MPAADRWAHLRAQPRQSNVGLTVDQAMAVVQADNPTLKDVLPRDYARPALGKRRLGQWIDLLSNIRVGDENARSPRRARSRLRVLPVAIHAMPVSVWVVWVRAFSTGRRPAIGTRPKG